MTETKDPAYFDARSVGALPGHLGLHITSVTSGEIRSEFKVQPHHMEPNGFLHAGSI